MSSEDRTRSAASSAPDAGAYAGDPLLGTTIAGRYKVLGVIGEGGFGVVYEAEQTQPVRRRVAMKVIKPGMDSRAVVARFEAERQALAVMDHPGIARVLDAGETDRGLPFFVMELVRGEPITAFCDKNRLSIDQRVELMIEVAGAVQHAHAKGVIHRDLKPSNILVGYDADGHARPKVIDFGVAKALNQRLSEHTVFTDRGQMIGTPEYMSPEQAEMSGTDVDTRADVYSLGVLLYELLAGVRPFDLKRAAFHEIQRVIREVDPPRPSTRLWTVLSGGDDPETASRIVRARRTDPRSLTGVLKRDLDWVVMRSLEKDRERRYDTANGLAAELRRYLEGEAVEAGPPGAAYRLAKFVSRNKGPVAAGAAISVLLLVGIITLSLMYQWAMTERDRARQLAAAESARTERALAAMTQLLSDSGVFDQKGIKPGETARLDLATSDEVYFEVTRHSDGTDSVTPRCHPGDPGEKAVELLASESVYWTQRALALERKRANELESALEREKAAREAMRREKARAEELKTRASELSEEAEALREKSILDRLPRLAKEIEGPAFMTNEEILAASDLWSKTIPVDFSEVGLRDVLRFLANVSNIELDTTCLDAIFDDKMPSISLKVTLQPPSAPDGIGGRVPVAA